MSYEFDPNQSAFVLEPAPPEEIPTFRYTTALKKLRKLKRRIKVIPGGTSAGKTYNILPILIDEAIKKPGSEISVVSESVPHLKKGALKDFLKIMRATGRFIDAHYNKTDRVYTFANKSYIEFFSADMEDKVRGPRRHVLYVNECNNLSFETYHQLAIRTSRSVWLDFNPSEEFWAYKECAPDDDTEWLTLTYQDNEGLPLSIKKEIEKAREKGFHDPYGSIEDENNIKNNYWANWWKVYGLGKPGILKGVIYSNWGIIKTVPSDAKFLGIGLDWGWSNVNAAVEIYEWGNRYVLNQILYEKELTNDKISEKLPKGARICADTADPKSIAEFKKLEHTMVDFKKGLVAYGIQFVQQHDLLVTEDSVETIKEFRTYRWDEDKHGNQLGEPVKKDDHAMDAIRYGFLGLVGQKKRKAKFGWGTKT